MIPHHSLHALSGTASLALKMHGPNFTVSGGPDACSDAFLAVAGIISEESVPGIWLLLTDFAPEYIPDEASPLTLPSDLVCHAAALTLMPPGSARSAAILNITCSDFQDAPVFNLSQFNQALESGDFSSSWQLSGTGGIWLDHTAQCSVTR